MSNDKIMNYLVIERGMTEKVAKGILNKLSTFDDIRDEFCLWLDTRVFPESGIFVENMNAKKLNETTYLSPVGAYTFLVYLRENPDEALKKLKAGLPKK